MLKAGLVCVRAYVLSVLGGLGQSKPIILTEPTESSWFTVVIKSIFRASGQTASKGMKV